MAGINDLVKEVAEYDFSGKVTKEVIKEVIEATCAEIISMTENGEKVIIKNFGTFSEVHKDARTGRNPQTGAAVKIPAKDVLKFKPAKKA